MYPILLLRYYELFINFFFRSRNLDNDTFFPDRALIIQRVEKIELLDAIIACRIPVDRIYY